MSFYTSYICTEEGENYGSLKRSQAKLDLWRIRMGGVEQRKMEGNEGRVWELKGGDGGRSTDGRGKMNTPCLCC